MNYSKLIRRVFTTVFHSSRQTCLQIVLEIFKIHYLCLIEFALYNGTNQIVKKSTNPPIWHPRHARANSHYLNPGKRDGGMNPCLLFTFNPNLN